MNESLPDQDLLRDFTERGSESAFQALVQRHADMVFATALRRVGEAAAQEVMQDVFIALARKAAWLRGEASIAGWLYKTTLFKARQWWRGESRRRQREQTAVELNTTMKDDDLSPKSLEDVLDDGLLELRETERQALLLRFFEQRSHREIGAALGIGEDAARKRVNKGLARLTGFFQKRGYAVGSAAAATAALNAAALSAPAGLVAQAAQVALAQAGGGPLPWLARWLAKLLRPSKTSTAALCTALLLGPPAWQGARWMSAEDEQRRMEGLLAALQVQRNGVAQDLSQVQRQLRRAATSLAQFHVLSQYSALLTEANLDPRLFRWDESANYVRVPKMVMRWLSFDTGQQDEERTLNYHGARLSPTLLGALGLNAEEQARVQQFCQSQMDAYQASAESRSYFTNQPPLDDATHGFSFTPDTRAWFTPALSPEESGACREGFQKGLTNLIGAERTTVILVNARDDGSLSVCFQGFGSEEDVIAVTPCAGGVCKVGKLHHARDGKPQGMSGQSPDIPLSSAISAGLPEPPDPSDPSATPSLPATWWVLERRPLPAALGDYLRQWIADHPEVPDEAPKAP
jgi:RNA polymerase sigma factor (sigma-70 family)